MRPQICFLIVSEVKTTKTVIKHPRSVQSDCPVIITCLYYLIAYLIPTKTTKKVGNLKLFTEEFPIKCQNGAKKH